MRLVMYPSFLRLMGKCKNASTFKIKRKYVLHQTHLRFTLNVEAFSFKRTCVFSSL